MKRSRRLGRRENRTRKLRTPLSLRTSEATLTPAIVRQIEGARWTKRLSGNAGLSNSFHDARGRKNPGAFRIESSAFGVLSNFRGWRKSQPKNILKKHRMPALARC